MEDREKESPLAEVETEGSEGEDVESGPASVGEPGETDDAAKLKKQLAYLAAEFENYRKRVAREREAQAAFGNEQLLLSILPFLDNLERAMGQATASSKALLSGVRMTYDQFLSELRKLSNSAARYASCSFSFAASPVSPGSPPLAGPASTSSAVGPFATVSANDDSFSLLSIPFLSW